MNLLLDTHVALWAITDSPKLTTKARELIASPKTNVWISTASIWEIAIKHSLGRGDMPISGKDAMRYFSESGFDGFLSKQSMPLQLKTCLHTITIRSTASLLRRRSLSQCA